MGAEQEIRNMIRYGAALTGRPTAVTLSDGRVTQAMPGFADADDTLLGTGTEINGTEKTLRFLVADAYGLVKNGAQLTWNGVQYRIKHTQLLASGLVIKAFLRDAQ
jgi:hypothetical protein